MDEEIISVPRWCLEEIDDVLRMYVNDEDCSKRVTCRDRQTMIAYNMTRQLLQKGVYEYETSHMLRYRQIPD